jgi:hypothetical protein
MDFTGRPLKGFVFIEGEALSTDRQLRDWLLMARASRKTCLETRAQVSGAIAQRRCAPARRRRAVRPWVPEHRRREKVRRSRDRRGTRAAYD